MSFAVRKQLQLFSEFQNLSKTNHTSKIAKKLKEIEAVHGLPAEAPPVVDCTHMIMARVNNDRDKEIEFARKLIATKNMEYTIITELLATLTAYNLYSDIEELYKILAFAMKNKAELFRNLMGLEFMNKNYKEAQTSAMSIVRLENTDANIGTAAFAYYILGKQENNPVFFKFGLAFIEKVKNLSQGVIQLKINLLDANSKYQEIIDYVNQENVKELFKPNDLVLRRAEMEAYRKLNKLEEVANCAARFLAEYNDDSIDEWRLVVQYHADPKSLIEKYKNGIKRGPYLAEIDLALKNGEDIAPLLLQYSDRFLKKNCVFGDLKKYFTKEICSKIQNISDPACSAFVTGKLNFESSEGRLAAIAGEFYLSKYLETKDVEQFKLAVNEARKFPDHPDSQFLFIRLCGIAKMVSAESAAWEHLRLEGIQYFSLSSTIVTDAINNFNVDVLKEFCNHGAFYYSKSIPNFSSAIDKACQHLNYFNVESMINFCQQIFSHSMHYLFCSLDAIFNVIDGKYFNYELDNLQILSKIELFNKTDRTVLPIYFDNENLKNAMYPEIIEKVHNFGAVARTLLSLFLEKSDTSLEEIKAPEWKPFVEYIKSEGKVVPEQCNMFTLLCICAAAKKFNKIAEQKEKLSKLLDEASKPMQVDTQMLTKDLEERLEKENQSINKSIQFIRNLLQ
ncbi:hypothetical protein TVAG_138090 [Trichomonas vaginalis G3]|uniref:Uncharacterized protein n=1 Tax=Trichomonas vaginalis (strain ATCC PRA-98 / G3) TaxID=412133 RepID=A2EC40_TRIV3|nr:N-terminal acetyltransferase-related family [Trichomonas vaginalis G3]EAY09815.1 hypothetical protein TVAG_138090 [Trichomonas vaginalis G3]KAI5525766.1 N-terminal acetyltransferase-related family [Trichomonas vaginalis G3]|eukprot:XP_001322038.1 hypothetical protein [Trichomonas vaginalis G3]